MARKTHKGAAKRFKLTGTGKLMRWRAGKSHLLGKKSREKKRRLLKNREVTTANAQTIRKILPHGGGV